MNEAIKENLIIVVYVIIYISSIFFLMEYFGLGNSLTIHYSYKFLTVFSLIISACFLIIKILKGQTWNYINARSIFGFITIFFLTSIFKSSFASMKQLIPYINPFVRIIDWFYMLWFLFLALFCLLMAWSTKRRLRLNFFIVSLIVWTIFGSVLGTTFSSAGPCYYDKVVDEKANPYQPLMDKLNGINSIKPLWAIHNQKGIWKAHLEKKWLPFGGISAMPSVHVAMAVVFALTAWQINKFFGSFFIFYLIVMQVGSVVLRWHYAVDGYLSIILTYLTWYFVKKLPIKINDIDHQINN